MKSLVRNALLGAAGLVALSLSANAAGTTTITDTPAVTPAATTKPMQLAQGGVGYKQTKKKKAKKKKAE